MRSLSYVGLTYLFFCSVQGIIKVGAFGSFFLLIIAIALAVFTTNAVAKILK